MKTKQRYKLCVYCFMVTCIVTLLYCSSSRRQSPSPSPIRQCGTNLVLILCHHPLPKDGTKAELVMRDKTARDFTRQINQTLVLLKSLAIQGFHRKECYKVFIVLEGWMQFTQIADKIRTEWSIGYQGVLQLVPVQVKYPAGAEWMLNMFRPCATLRLFLPELLPPEIKTIVYADTDFIFFNSPHFLIPMKLKEDTVKSIASMAPCLFHYGTSANNVPYYGRTGLNAGLMVMRLQRMREIGWSNRLRMVAAMFQHKIKLADQDILNIYFHFFPEELTLLSCDWNFRPFQCREGSYCDDHELAKGISAIHGNALSFTPSGTEPLFELLFNIFHNVHLNQSFTLEGFVESLEMELLHGEETLHSECVRYGGFSAMILNRLDQLAKEGDNKNNNT